MSQPLVSVIITTKNSSTTLVALLESIMSQSYKNVEVILVDNNSSDHTVSIAKKYTSKVFQKGPERSTQRNYGAKVSKGDYLLFLDSDMVLGENIVKECVDIFKDEDSKAIGAVVIPERSFGTSFWAKAKTLERKINEGERFFEAARFFPSSIFKEVKGYDISLTGPEDWDLPERVADKYKTVRIKSYIMHNEGDLKLSYLAKKKYYYGLSAHKYFKKRKIPIISRKTIYFLRPAYYRNLNKFFEDPVLFLGMIFMLITESIAGGLGYLKGIIINE